MARRAVPTDAGQGGFSETAVTLRADVRVVFENEPPREMRCLGNSYPRGFDNRVERRGGKDFESVSPQEIEAVAGAVNPERLGQLSRAGAEARGIVSIPSPPHAGDPACGGEGADENEAILGASLDEEIQEPVDTVVQVNVCGARRVVGDEAPRGRPAERVAGLVIPHGIRLGFDDDPAASFPEQLAADEHPGAGEGIAHEKPPVHRFGVAFHQVLNTNSAVEPLNYTKSHKLTER